MSSDNETYTSHDLAPLAPRDLHDLAGIYAQMVELVAHCASVDEVVDLDNRAKAAQVFYHQANNYETEVLCSRIRVRAERRLGELLTEMSARGERSTGGKPSSGSTVYTLADMGITKDRASKAQRLARVPDGMFTELVERPKIASSAAIIKEHRRSNLPLDARDDESDSVAEDDDDNAEGEDANPVVDDDEINRRVDERLKAAVDAMVRYLRITELELREVLAAIGGDEAARDGARMTVMRIAAGLNILAAEDDAATSATPHVGNQTEAEVRV